MDACKATNSAPIEIPNGSFTDVPLDTTIYETTPGMHDTVVQNNRIKVLVNGRFNVFCGVTFDAGGGEIRELLLQKNGTNVGGETIGAKSDVPVGGGNLHSIEVNAKGVQMQAGEWFNAVVFQDSGAPLNVEGGGQEFTPVLYVEQVS